MKLETQINTPSKILFIMETLRGCAWSVCFCILYQVPEGINNKFFRRGENHASDLKTKSEEIIEDVSKAIQKLDNQNSVLTETKKLCDDIKGDIENLKDSINAQFESMRSTLNINRWIAIIGILALIVLHFI